MNFRKVLLIAFLSKIILANVFVANANVLNSNSGCLFSWESQNSGISTTLLTVKTVNGTIIWIGGEDGVILKSTNSGTNWTDVGSNVFQDNIYCIDALDENIAFAITFNTSFDTSGIYRTTNGGQNWLRVFGVANSFLNALQMVDANNGYAYGDPIGGTWNILKTSDGGANWSKILTAPSASGSEYGFSGAFQVLGDRIWFGSSATKMYYSTDLGINWSSAEVTGSPQVYTVHFNNSSVGLGGGSSLLKSTDGGVSWNSMSSFVTSVGPFTGVDGINSDFWFVKDNEIHMTTNEGNNWSQVYTSANYLTHLDLAMDNSCLVGWAVGEFGTIVRMSNITSIENENSEFVNEYKLFQNYPNPFNPNTNIKFSLPKSGFVSLKVYDSNGEEISTLLNEYKSSGTYIIDFNKKELASGVYFYKLIAGEFRDTKRMLLVK